jgi:hypothetical protein
MLAGADLAPVYDSAMTGMPSRTCLRAQLALTARTTTHRFEAVSTKRIGHNRPLITMVFLVIAQVWGGPAYASTFALIHGRQFELCRGYEQNLKSYATPSRLDHEWPLDPALKEFRKPQWQSVDARENLEIVKTIFLWRTDPNKRDGGAKAEAKWQEELPRTLTLIENKQVRLDLARVDFDADGKADRVYRYYHPIKFLSSGAPPEYGYSYIYFPDDSQYPEESWRMDAGNLYDSFLYRGRFYLLGWFSPGLTIWEPKGGSQGVALIGVCVFKFND